MKKIFIKDDRLREIVIDRNKGIKRLLLDGTLKGTISFKLATKEVKGRICYGWEITDLEDGYKIGGRFGETKKKLIEPTGSITPLRDSFKPVKNIGVFPKPKLERNNNTK